MKKVIKVSTKQLFKVYWLLGLWILFFLYLTIYNGICDCLYLVSGEGLVLFFSFMLSAMLTATWWRKQHRKNWISDESRKLEIPSAPDS